MGRMDERLEDFAGLLRQNGLRISPAEVADAARATLLVGLDERAPFRAALRATLVKRGADAPVFDRLFELYFTGAKDLLEGLQGSLLDALAAETLDDLELEEAARVLAQMQLSKLTDALVHGRADELARLLRQATLSLDFRGLQSPLQRGFYARRLMQAAGGTRAEQELQAFLLRLKQQGFEAGSLEVVSRRVSHTLKALEDAARRIAENEQKARDPEQKGEGTLTQRNLATLTPAEVERMRAVVRRLAERLKTRLTRKRKVRRRGALSVRRTLRKNLSTGGFPARLVFRSKRPERPEILVLCDVSDSVRNVSRLMLQFVYTLQELYSRVRSFVFVSEVGEVTHLFKKMDVSTAVDLRPRLQDVPYLVPGLGDAPLDGDRHRRRPHQLQPAQRMGAGRGEAQGPAGDLAVSRGSRELGIRRQRDAALRPALHAGGGGQVGRRPRQGRL